MTIYVQIFLYMYVLSWILRYYTAAYGYVCLFKKKYQIIFQIGHIILHSHLQGLRAQYSTLLPTFGIINFFFQFWLCVCVVNRLSLLFDQHVLMMNGIEHPSTCLFPISMSSFLKCVFKTFARFLKWIIFFLLLLNFKNSYISWIQAVCQIHIL